MDAKIIKKKIKVHIKSCISDMRLTDGQQLTEFDDILTHKQKKPTFLMQDTEPVEEIIEYSTEGTLTINGKTVEIAYSENEDLGMSGIKSTLRFKKNLPTMVNLIRSGSAPTSLIFDKQFPRRNCMYSIGGMSFDFCICTNDVINIFGEDGGKIILDYEIEIHGMKTEHNVFTIEYKE